MAKKLKLYAFIFLFASLSLPSLAQVGRPEVLRKVSEGDSLRLIYRFEESLSAYDKALDLLGGIASPAISDTTTVATDTTVAADSLLAIDIQDRILLSENGRTMSQYVDFPTVIARHKFSIEDFYLYYPLPDRFWRNNPNQLDSCASHPFYKAIYLPESESRHFYSAADSEGIHNIYGITKQDSLWTLPALLNEHMTSPSDEIYPMLSPDGRTLYFASDGLFGVGGFDLYKSEWDEETGDWSSPVNLGFPYSSPYDDFLLIDTEDGNHTIFASNRDCPSDSVWVYVLESDLIPVRKAVDNPEELQEIASLTPQDNTDRDKPSDVDIDIPENIDTRRYMEQMSKVKALRDTLGARSVTLETDRTRYAMSSDADERIGISERIMALEAGIPLLQDSLKMALDQLQKIEMEFLFNGVVIDPDKVLADADREVVGEATSFTFTKMSPGDAPRFEFVVPEPEIDYTFRISDIGQIIPSENIPDGIVYQIQLFASAFKASAKDIRGLSPVFEFHPSASRYVYRAGLFTSYKDVLSHLNAVKRADFRNAIIVALKDRSEIKVATARAAENAAREAAKAAPTLYNVRIVPETGELDEFQYSSLRTFSNNADIARLEENDGTQVFLLGPFVDKSKADDIATQAALIIPGEVSVTPIQ